ncbi:hypothetical protein [Microvirga massiliensis]|uniref:hypothetical protein n=1 Tax=Microvirga massiliensis TaxID=1033741 RepID=UPI00062B611D|nr:hypothetical protein [Microvirga massiliensis]
MRTTHVIEVDDPTALRRADLAVEIRRVLAALADDEARFNLDRRSLLEWSGPEALKQRFLALLEARHTRQRELLAQRLAELRLCTSARSASGGAHLAS